MINRLVFPLALAALYSGSIPVKCHAAKVKVWHEHTPTQYEKAQWHGAVISNEGTLRLTRQLRPLADLDASHVWDVVEDGDGNLYAATGGEGKVWKIAPDGKTSVVYSGEESQVLCLAIGGDGMVYAGTGPTGHILRINPRGNAKVLCETGEMYVWSLVFDSKNKTLFAGTGPRGRILRITPDGAASVFCTTKQEHILCLAVGPDDLLYAGTGKGGLVYRIDAKGKGFIIHQTPQAEVRCLRVTPDSLYIGTSVPTKRRGASASAHSGIGSFEASALHEMSDKAMVAAASGGSVMATEEKLFSKGSLSAMPTIPSSGENSVYRITSDGAVREVFREKAMVMSLLKQSGNQLFVGTGMDGQLFEVDEASRERSEIARLDQGQILCMLHRRDGSVVLGTGDPGKLYVMQDKYASKGSVVSEVLDAKLVSKWGALRWEADTPAGTTVTVATRSGNVAEPDETWSDWSPEQADAQTATIGSPTARFLQYRVTLATNNVGVTPAVRSVSLRYATVNQAPEVTKVEAPDLNAVSLENPKKLKFKWSATDANEDDLTYSLFVRKDGWSNWVELEDDIEKTEYEWDTTTMPTGVYQFKVVASDRKDNPDNEALSGERTSTPFIVCHTAPTIVVKVAGLDGDKAIIEATASSQLVRLTAASFAVNGKKWINVFPTDGLFDDKAETFKFTTESLKPGTYVLVMKVRDAAGNTGSGDVVFRVELPKK